MLLKDVLASEQLKKQLVESIKNNRVAHAQLFTGSSGNAKLALALAYAQLLNCENRKELDSCANCPSCLKYENYMHPDLYCIFPVVKKTETNKKPLSKDFIHEWREEVIKNPYLTLNKWIQHITDSKSKLGEIYTHEITSLQKDLTLKIYEARFRVILIWLPEKMNLQAANKLLKMLEEPPKGTIFLLISEHPENLLPTILSRLQKIKVNRCTIEDFAVFFDKKGISQNKIEQLYNITNGDLSRAINEIENINHQEELLDHFIEWMRLCYRSDIQEINTWVEETARSGKKKQNLFLMYAIRMVRSCLIYNYAGSRIQNNTEKELIFLEKFAPFIHEKNILSIAERLEDAITHINRNANQKIIFYELSLQMIKLLKVKRTFVE